MYKRMSRVLETQLRAADIFNSLAMVEVSLRTLPEVAQPVGCAAA